MADYRKPRRGERPPREEAHDGALLPVAGLSALADRNVKLAMFERGALLAVGEREALTLYELRRARDSFSADPIMRYRLPGPVLALTVLRAGTVAVATANGDSTSLQIVDRNSSRFLTTLPGHIKELALAGGRLVAAQPAGAERLAALVALDASTGRISWTRPLASADVTLSADARGRAVMVTDRRAQTVTRVPIEEKCEPGTNRPPHRPHTSEPPASPPCGCGRARPHPCDHDKPPGSSSHPPPPRRPRPDDPCRPGNGWIPDDCDEWITVGGVLARNPLCADDPPCKQRLDFTIASLSFAGSQILARSASGHRIALLDPRTLCVNHTRSLGKQGALVASAPDADLVLVHSWRNRRWGVLDIAAALERRPSLDLGYAQPPAESITFYGHNPEGIPPAPDPQLGVKRVIALPFIEPGQSFTDSNLNAFGGFMQSNAFDIVRAYYDEASFGLVDLQIDLFGYDVGPAGTPLQMPNPYRSYFWPPFVAGGLRAVEAAGASPYDVALDGSESLTLHVVPRERAEDDLVVPFCALGLSERYDLFPVSLAFDGSQSVELDVTDSSGTVWNLDLAFPAQTITIEAGDIAGGLADLRGYLANVIQTAESNAGVPGGDPLFVAVETRRVRRSGYDFGDLDINLRMADGAGSAKGRVGVVAQSGLAMIGFDTPIIGQFSLGADSGLLDAYLERALRQADVDAGYDFANRLLGGASVIFDNASDTLTIQITLSDVDGGDGASISVAAESGLSNLGFDDAASMPGESDPNDANALRYSQEFLDDAFTALIDRLGGEDTDLFDPYIAVLIAIVGAPSAGQWGATQPDITDLRMFARNRTAKYALDDSIQLQSRFIGTILDAAPDNATTSHEIGHALGLSDLYYQDGYRDDLLYMDAWDLMDDDDAFSHFGGYHKYVLGWIDSDRVVPVDLPSPAGPTSAEALLVPVEYWDDDMQAAVQAEFGDGIPVAQLMSIDLGGDGAQFDLVEARQAGLQFSHSLPVGPGLVVCNAIDPDDDTRYAELNLYRRKLHRLNSGSDLQSAGDTFDLAAAPELAAVGVSVTVLDVRAIARPYGMITVFHTRVDRAQADYVDLSFTEATPNWQCPDIWVDWAGDNPSADPADHHIYAEGTPSDQGEAVHYPSSGSELHWVVARVHNRGTADALNVKINFLKWDPPGAGDTGNKQIFGSETIDIVPAGGFVTAPARWSITPAEREHQCLRCEIADWELPEDPVDAIALASDDVWLSNNWGQKNVFDFVALGGSPYDPIDFRYSVTNDGIRPEKAYLEPEGLPVGMKLTVTPRARLIAPGETAIFTCRLELDYEVIDAGCRNDREFLLVAWRETQESFERWGACKYKVRPRHRTAVSISGWWGPQDIITVSGGVAPDPGGGRALLRIAFDGQDPRWQPAALQPGGAYQLQFEAEAQRHLEVVAYYEGSIEQAPAYSPLLPLDPPEPVP